MNFNKAILIFITTLSVLGCNNSKGNKTTENVETLLDIKAWHIKLSEHSPLNAEELARLFPSELHGMPLIGFETLGVQSVVGTYSKNVDPDYSSTTISLTLVDGAGSNGLPHVKAIFKELNSNLNHFFDDGWAKTTMHNNQRILVKEHIKTEKTGIQSTVTSSIDMIINQRFHMNLTGRHLPGSQLIKALDELVKLSFPE